MFVEMTKHVDWSKVPLGTVTSNKLAKKLGVTGQAVRLARKRLGIPVPICARNAVEAKANARALRACILNALYDVNPTPMRILLQRVKDDFGGVTERTVFRALTRLCKQGKVLHIKPPNTSAVVWGYIRKGHYHGEEDC